MAGSFTDGGARVASGETSTVGGGATGVWAVATESGVAFALSRIRLRLPGFA